MKSVTVIGGGLAGLSLGVGLAKRNIPVEIREAGTYPRHRVCGEFISGIDQSTLEELGIQSALSDARLHTTGTWFRRNRKILTMELPTPAHGISRWRLDERLKQLVERSGGTVLTETRSSLTPTEGTVVAAGRQATKSNWLGLKCHLRDFPLEVGLEMHLGNNGYIGLTPIEEGKVNLCGLFKLNPECRGKGSQLLLHYLEDGGHDALIERLTTSEFDEASVTGVSSLSLGWQKHEDNAFVIGDSGSVIPPFTGNGMSMAFESAAHSIGPLSDWSLGSESWASITRRAMLTQRRAFRKRISASLALQQALLNSRGQDLFEILSRHNLLPFHSLLSLVR